MEEMTPSGWENDIIITLFEYVRDVFPEAMEFDINGPEARYSRAYRKRILEDAQILLFFRGCGTFTLGSV